MEIDDRLSNLENYDKKLLFTEFGNKKLIIDLN